MNIKNLLKQHLTAILCAISILALAFPLITVSSDYGDQTITGFGAIEHAGLSTCLIILPALLAVSGYVKAAQKYSTILGTAIPAFCLLLLILVFSTCKKVASGGADAFSGFGIDIDVKIGFCTILAAASYIATAVWTVISGRKTGVSVGSISMPQIDASAILETVHEKASVVADRVKSAAADVAAGVSSSGDGSAPVKKTNINRTNEILALIEKLSAMKEAGVLTEEEFSMKKQSLLEEI